MTTNVYESNVSGFWDDTLNWSLQTIPSENHDVNIPTNSEVAIENSTALAQSVFIDRGTLIIKSSLTINRNQTVGAGIYNQGYVGNFGELIISRCNDVRLSG